MKSLITMLSSPRVRAGLMAAFGVSWLFAGVDNFVGCIYAKPEEAMGAWEFTTNVARLVVGAGLAFWAWKIFDREGFSGLRHVRELYPAKMRPKRMLVLFASLDSGFKNNTTKHITPTAEMSVPVDWAACVALLRENYWPWEMPLTAVKEHLQRLEVVILIGTKASARDVGSHGALSELAKWIAAVAAFEGKPLSTYFADSGGVRPMGTWSSAGGVDVASYDDSYKTVQQCLDYAKQQLKIQPRDIAIDVTSGVRKCAVAAFAVTVNSDCAANLVDTNLKEVNVLEVSIRADAAID